MRTKTTFNTDRVRLRPAESGFTLVELSVSMLVLAAVIVGILALFDSTNQLARTQLNRVDLQQSLRVSQREMVRTIRLAGRGGLPAAAAGAKLPDDGWALRVINNAQGRTVLDGGGGADVVDDTDVLIVRGVINTPVYVIEHLNPASFSVDTTDEKGQITIRGLMPVGGVEQDLSAVCEMLNGGDNRPEALLMVSAFDDRVFGVAQIDYNASDGSKCPTNDGDPPAEDVRLAFIYGGNSVADKYAELSSDGTSDGTFPDELMSRGRVSSVGVLEEYRFYLREGSQMDNPDEVSTPFGATIRKLSRARVYPKTDTPYDNSAANLQMDIAENVMDFQVAVAIDKNRDGLLPDDGTGTDDWLGNSVDDDPTNGIWDAALDADGGSELVRYVRLTTLARAVDGERSNLSKVLARLEDHVFSPTDPLNDEERKFPRIVLQSVAEMRNL